MHDHDDRLRRRRSGAHVKPSDLDASTKYVELVHAINGTVVGQQDLEPGCVRYGAHAGCRAASPGVPGVDWDCCTT